MSARDWTEISLAQTPSFADELHLRAQNMASGEIFPLHDHPWHQLVYATQGTLMIRLAQAWHVVTPEQAVWIPKGVRHATAALTDSAFRTLYISSDVISMPAQVRVLSVSTLLRSLIMELDGLSSDAMSKNYRSALHQTILRHLERQPHDEVGLTWPAHPALRHLCESLYDHPADTRSVADLARAFGMSERTLMRRCHADLAMPLSLWRQRMRLFRALEWLGQKRSITEIAFDLGYNSPSAFGHMFRTATGLSPSDWRKARGLGVQSSDVS
ncbi:AraC family transcriptional regulator [Thioclava indica]|uniref:HTH araC/xylS-type domain-containing protein n=1 Tax=Thioclava indica TaxID=1353528 RepID=A0A074JMP6_9RHOB|nr:helix-turn-helix transcriptional regulator [Thioclava indica]KEO57180.1 hypothetical protein DT23_17075 [Thioclava indica]